MKIDSLDKYTGSFGLSLAITVLFSSLLVVVKELSENTVLAWMKRVTVHHWVTHGIIDLVIFVVLGLLLTRVKVTSRSLIPVIVVSVAVGAVAVAGFYLFFGD